jgi:hypothetical protein
MLALIELFDSLLIEQLELINPYEQFPKVFLVDFIDERLSEGQLSCLIF